MHLRTPLVLLSIFLLLYLPGRVQGTVVSDQKGIFLALHESSYPVGDNQQYYFYDPAGEVLPTELFRGLHDHRFHEVDFDTKYTDVSDIEEGHSIWIRLIVYNNFLSGSGTFYLEPQGTAVRELVLFQRLDTGNFGIERSGRSIKPALKPVNISGSDDLPFTIRHGQQDTLFLKIVTGKLTRLPDLDFDISSMEEAIRSDRRKRLAFGVFAGIFLIMILYHISLYVRGRERSFLYYILYITSFLIFFIHKEGFIYEAIMDPGILNMNKILLEIFLIFFLLFGIAYLDLKNRMDNWYQILQIAVWFSLLGVLINLLVSLLHGLGVSIPNFVNLFIEAIFILSISGCLLLAIFPAWILTKENYQPARYFLIANVFILAGVLATSLLTLEWFEDHGEDIESLATIMKHGIEIGVTLQILTFSIGLSERINLLKIGRELAQRKIIEQLRENASLKDKVTQELEDKVQERTFEIQAQKEHIEKQNKEIKYSFDYAKKIQSTVLPTNDIFETLFAEHFIFFKPKDIVSGDFYWITQNQTKIVLTAADCTGHGVPGSLMSMLGITMLHEIVNEKNIRHSDEILNQLRLSIARTLKQEGRIGEQKDGIDMALMIYDTKTRELEYSGANSPLYIIRNGEMLEYKGNNMPVAFYERMSDFTRYSIEMQKGDRVYMFTDGFPDQFGGPQGKKFKHRPFKELLIEVHDRPMEEQQRILSLIFDEWKGDLSQIDDVLVIGLRL